MTRGHEQHVITDSLELADLFALDLGNAHYACQIIARLLAAFLDQRHKISLETSERLEDAFGMPRRITTGPGVTCGGLVLAAQKLLKQIEQQRLVVFRNSENLHDGQQRKS